LSQIDVEDLKQHVLGPKTVETILSGAGLDRFAAEQRLTDGDFHAEMREMRRLKNGNQID
jgi:hypothetical protein